jgi:hypothetical protein
MTPFCSLWLNNIPWYIHTTFSLSETPREERKDREFQRESKIDQRLLQYRSKSQFVADEEICEEIFLKK